ncbi:DUF7521 family protein [Haloarcula litorea]|uniref:DUF7521 family protein n=1 Tax=Haloarcula litorea TaxID=3032579 RepID=UPI0023E89E8D|nr:hypothetical protein [Halomicroarcula sp. GDY20]
MVAVDPATVRFLTAALTAVLGAAVAGLAYRGARRNDSGTMRLLAVGVACIAVLPFLVNYGVAPLADLSDAETLLGVLGCFNAGLVAVLYSLEGT